MTDDKTTPRYRGVVSERKYLVYLRTAALCFLL
jgi:hypothetical protein